MEPKNRENAEKQNTSRPKNLNEWEANFGTPFDDDTTGNENEKE